jgi:hypothetical protein
LLVFALFAVVLEFDDFFTGWNSAVLNTALVATFAPPQAPRMAGAQYFRDPNPVSVSLT